jgi:hypothetical protein
MSCQVGGHALASEYGAPHKGLVVVSHVSWWALDPEGYHPSILLKIENNTGRDLTGEKIRLQARFTNLRNGIVSVGRVEVRKSFVPRSRIYVRIHGTEPFELPISISQWPPIECKVLARIAEVGDEGTQTLLLTDVEREAMSDDDAFSRIEKLRDYTQVSAAERQEHLPQAPMAATAGILKGVKPPKPTHKPGYKEASIASLLAGTPMPGIGEDFSSFERKFGLPTAIEKEPGWTWAAYKHPDPQIIVCAGSPGRSGKVDIVIAQIPGSIVQSDTSLVDLANSMAGKFKGQKLGTANRSVRYLTTGRIEQVTARGTSFQATYFPPRSPGRDGLYTLVVSRPTAELEPLLGDHIKHVSMLRPLANFLEL